MSIIISVIAVCISLLALYLTRLRRARIRLSIVPGDPPTLGSSSWITGGRGGPTSPEVTGNLLLENTGARSGVLLSFGLGLYSEEGSQGQIFQPMNAKLDKVSVSDTIEADSPRVVRFRVPLRPAYPGRNEGSGVAFAWLLDRLSECSSIAVELSYVTIRGGPRRRQEHQIRFDVSTDKLKRQWIEQARGEGGIRDRLAPPMQVDG